MLKETTSVVIRSGLAEMKTYWVSAAWAFIATALSASFGLTRLNLFLMAAVVWLGSLLVSAYIAGTAKESETPQVPRIDTPSVEEPLKPLPIIQLTFDPMGAPLPVAIPPRGMITVAFLDPNGKVEVFGFTNRDHDKRVMWPTDLISGELVGILRIANLGEVPAFNVVISYMGMSSKNTAKPYRGQFQPMTLPAGGEKEQTIYIINRCTKIVRKSDSSVDDQALEMPFMWFDPVALAQPLGKKTHKPVSLSLVGMIPPTTLRDDVTGRAFLGPLAPQIVANPWW